MTTQTLTLRIDATAAGLRAAVVDGKGQLGQLERQAAQTGGAFSRMGALISGAVAGRAIASAANEWGEYRTRVQQAARANETLAQVTDRVYESAQRTRSDLVATGVLYERVDKVMRDLGGSTAQSAAIVETINRGFIISGASAQESAGSIRQFAQGLQSGVLRGDEFNSVMEGAPVIADALSQALGVTRGELRAMAEAGELSSARVLAAISTAAPEIEAQFNRIAVRPSQAFQQLSNAFTRAVGEIDEAVGGSSAVASGLQSLTRYIERIPQALTGWASEFARVGEIGNGVVNDVIAALGFVGDAASNLVADVGQEFLILPTSLRTGVTVIVGEFDKLLARGSFLFQSIGVSAQEVWLGIRENAVGMANRVELVFAQMSDAIGRKLASIARDAAGVFDKVGLSSVAAELKVVEQQLLATATAEAEVQSRAQANSAGYRKEAEALDAKRVELLRVKDAAVAAADVGIQGALADRQAAIAALAAGKAKRDQAQATGVANGALTASTTATKADEQAANRLSAAKEQLVRIIEQSNAAGSRAEQVTARFSAKQREINDLIDRYPQLAGLGEQATRALGVAFEEAMRDADEFGQRVTQIMDGMADSTWAALSTLQIALDQAIDAGDTQRVEALVRTMEQLERQAGRSASASDVLRAGTDRMAEASRRAAEEYQRSWFNALDSVGGAFSDWISGGISSFREFGSQLKSIAKRFVADLVQQFIRSRIVIPVTAAISGTAAANPAGGGATQALSGAGGFGSSIGGLLGGAGALLGGTSVGTGLLASGSIFSGAGLLGGITGSISAGVASIAGGSIMQGIGLLAGPVGIIAGAVAAITSLLRSSKPPDLRFGGTNASVRNVEGQFQTTFGTVRAGSRQLSYEQLIEPIQQFDRGIEQIVQQIGGGAQQLEAIRDRLSRWSVDLRGNAATAEAVLGSRFGAILTTFSADVQRFVGSTGTIEERVSRLTDALTIEALTDGELEASFDQLAQLLLDARQGTEALGDTYTRLIAGVQLVDGALGILGGAFEGTRLEAASFAADLIDAAGGMDAFSSKLSAALDALFSPEEQAQFLARQAESAFRSALEGVGLSLDAGLDSVRQSLRSMIEQAFASGDVDAANRLLSVGASMGVFIQATERLDQTAGDAESSISDQADSTDRLGTSSESASDRMQRLQRELDALSQYQSFFADLRTETLSDGLSEFNRSLVDTARWQAEAVDRANAMARAAGLQAASEEDLELIRVRSAQRTRAAFLALESATASLITQLYAVADGQAQQVVTGNGALNLVQSWARTASEVADRFDPQRFQGAQQIAANIRQMSEVSRQSAFDIADRLKLPFDRFVADLGIVTSRLSEPQVFDDFVAAARTLGVELPDFATRIGASIGDLANASSAINDAFERAIRALPKAQSDQLQGLLSTLETATTAEARAQALGDIEAFVNKLPVEMRSALAPFLEGVDVTTIQEETVNAVRAVEGAIGTSNALLTDILEALRGGRRTGEKSAGDDGGDLALVTAQLAAQDVGQLRAIGEVRDKIGVLVTDTGKLHGVLERLLGQLLRSGK